VQWTSDKLGNALTEIDKPASAQSHLTLGYTIDYELGVREEAGGLRVDSLRQRTRSSICSPTAKPTVRPASIPSRKPGAEQVGMAVVQSAELIDPDPNDSYRVFVTKMKDTIALQAGFYNQQDGAENLIKEADNDAELEYPRTA
jgi:hypothetical protein